MHALLSISKINMLRELDLINSNESDEIHQKIYSLELNALKFLNTDYFSKL